MSIKTILVHLADDDELENRLSTAMKLAKRQKAHLTALFITTPISTPVEIIGRGASVGFLEGAVEAAKNRATELEERFKSACHRDGVDSSWFVTEGDHLHLLANHAHAADLVIVSQPKYESWEDNIRFRMAEELILLAGLPVLLIPRGFKPAEIGKRVLVSWKSTRESVRAVRDGISFMTSAEWVEVLTVGASTDNVLSEREVVRYLSRHMIEAEATNLPLGKAEIGAVVLERATSKEADLLIMGSYGHSRLREMVMGGVTRHILTHMTIPVLMSH